MFARLISVVAGDYQSRCLGCFREAFCLTAEINVDNVLVVICVFAGAFYEVPGSLDTHHRSFGACRNPMQARFNPTRVP